MRVVCVCKSCERKYSCLEIRTNLGAVQPFPSVTPLNRRRRLRSSRSKRFECALRTIACCLVPIAFFYLERLEPLADLNGAQRLNDLNVLNPRYSEQA